jgi:hypothetical protein
MSWGVFAKDFASWALMQAQEEKSFANTPQNSSLFLKICTENLVVNKKTRETGLEPATSAVTGQCSNQLNYSRAMRKLGHKWAQQDSNL